MIAGRLWEPEAVAQRRDLPVRPRAYAGHVWGLSPDEWTAVSAVVTGAATLVLAVLTVALARSTREAARAAAEASRLSQRQLQESVRPLLVPQAPRQDPDDPRRLLLPVRNIGVAPAVNLYAKAQTSTQAPEVLGQFPNGRLPGVAAGETEELSFNIASVTSKNLGRVELTFSDVAGQRYAAESTWDRRSGTFRHLRLQERDRLRVELIPLPGIRTRSARRLATLAGRAKRRAQRRA